jgi:lipopolysaccharide transport system ATP-binding protein
MTQAEIRKKFDEIVAFAGVEQFIDTPVKHFSSGMYLRLAFAVAAHLESEILVVDEVLAVGDVEFQKKCLGKMKHVARGEGRTVLFVSHNLAAIQTLCTEVLYFQGGQLVGSGEVERELARYTQDTALTSLDHGGRHQLSSWLVCESLDITPSPVRSGGAVRFSVTLSATRAATLKELAILFYSSIGTRVAILDLRSRQFPCAIQQERGIRLDASVRGLNFVEGEYAVGLYVNCGDTTGDFLDLYPLSVTKSERVPDIAPYSTHDRGYVELDYDVSLSLDQAPAC